MTRLVCISDTHNKLRNVPVVTGDILVHAGDMLSRGTLRELTEELGILADKFAPHYKAVVFIAGNHDWCWQRQPKESAEILEEFNKRCGGKLHYLQDSRVVIEDILFYGSPWTPEFYSWAFNLPRGKPLKDKWKWIPFGCDVLVTHGPPAKILDTTPSGESVGCDDLRWALMQIKPRVNVFGHIHKSYGEARIDDTTFINASVCNEAYEPVNPPIPFDI